MQIAKWVSLFCLLVSVVWLISALAGGAFEWEPLIASLGALVVFLGFVSVTPRTVGGHPNDIVLFRRFMELLPSTTIVAFYRNHDFGADFDKTYADPINQFAREWNNPDFHFADPKLEQKRKVLYERGNELALTMGRTVIATRGGFYSVVPDRLRGLPRPDWIVQDAEALNKHARAFVTAYDDFVQMARPRLHIE